MDVPKRGRNGRGGRDPASPTRVIRPVAAALSATDLRERWPAQAAETLAVALAVDRVAFVSFDVRGNPDDEIVVLDRSSGVPSASAALADFQECFAEEDPFLPLPDDDGTVAVTHGWPPMSGPEEAHREFAELCRGWGLVDTLTIHLSHGGRLAGHVLLWRLTGQAPFDASDVRLARAAQPLLTTSYAAVLRASPVSRTEASVMLEAAGLSAREREIARLVAQGATNKQIAAAISRSPNTVNTHVTRVLSKLGLGNRTQLAWFLAVATM